MTSLITAIGSLAAATSVSEKDLPVRDDAAAEHVATATHETVRHETPHYGLLATTVTNQHPGR